MTGRSDVLVIKEGDTFLCFDRNGDLDDRGELGLGLYHRDTRFLSHLRLSLSGRDPVLLSSSSNLGYLAQIDMTNPELSDGEGLAVPLGTVGVRRTRVVDGRLYERVEITSFNVDAVRVTLTVSLGADFMDIFHVRGLADERRGHLEPPQVSDRGAAFRYVGLDGVARRTVVEFDPAPDRVELDQGRVCASFDLHLAPRRSVVLSMSVEPSVGGRGPDPRDFDAALTHVRGSHQDWRRECTIVHTDHPGFNQLLARGLEDLRTLETHWDGGRIVAAGIPWFVAVFGRDALITSLQLLAVNPGLARETLETLAGLQGSRQDRWRDEEPGKIVHEVRRGELAGAGVIPQTRYYGTVDATPLFVLLFAMHFEWTADRRFAERLLPNVTAALEWIDRHGDIDGDGFVEYLCRSPLGSVNQGWKDSPDSVVHADGRPAVGPIALSEVQGYVYMAKARVAGVFETLGDRTAAARLRAEAVALRRRFDAAFWMEDEGCFAMALDGDKRQVRTVTSNPGHCLYSGIVEDDKAELLARRLVQPDMFSGWGIRTMSATAAAYNPMSYHNGSVWPHDTALIAAGLYRSGFVETADRVAAALFDAASHSRDLRLPELFCGFSRRASGGPVAYPTACAPQAWAAGAPFLILQAMLGISARADRETITIARPHLPSWLSTVELADLRAGPSHVSLVFRRRGETTSCSVAGRHGDVEVVVEE